MQRASARQPFDAYHERACRCCTRPRSSVGARRPRGEVLVAIYGTLFVELPDLLGDAWRLARRDVVDSLRVEPLAEVRHSRVRIGFNLPHDSLVELGELVL